MTISVANLTTGGTAVAATSFTTASVAPSARRVLLFTVIGRTASAIPESPTVSGLGLSWTLVKSTSNTLRRITTYAAMTGADAPASGAITIDYGSVSIAAVNWTLDAVTGGMGIRNIVAAAANSATSVSATYPDAFVDAANSLSYAAVMCIEGLIIPQAGWTELADHATGTGFFLETQYQVGSDTVASASRATSSTWGIIGVEVQVDATHYKTHDLWSTDHPDVDTTDAPTIDDVISWDGSKWVPVPQTGGGGVPAFLSQAKWGID